MVAPELFFNEVNNEDSRAGVFKVLAGWRKILQILSVCAGKRALKLSRA
jgi:hypothetical protein